MKKHTNPEQKTNTEKTKTQSQLIESLELDKSKRAGTEYCEYVSDIIDNHLNNRCNDKKNNLELCVESDDSACACSGSSGSGLGAKVDLIVLIDTSSSMGTIASTVSSAASAAIEQAQETCETDLKVTYMGVESTWPGTLFLTNSSSYLTPLLPSGAILSTDNPVGGFSGEEGANTIEDLSKHADWRKGACRAIFYISDEELDGSLPRGDTTNEALATNNAITSANLNDVTIFAHFVARLPAPTAPSVIANYNDLCNSTGGEAFISPTATNEDYVEFLSKVICNGCGSKCKEADFPIIKPCISISWGESDCDCLETDDVEVLCITVCNCYSNISFSDFSIGFVGITDNSGNALPSLPDGTPSAQILPVGPICFGDIPPCKDGKASCISREIVLWTRGAKGGSYKLLLAGVCYDIINHYGYFECFDIKLCQD